MTWIDVLKISFGWLLGLLSPAIILAISERREIKRLKNAIIFELKELQCRLVFTVFRVESKNGSIGHSFFTWAQEIFKDYDGINKDKINSESGLINAAARLLKISEDQFKAVFQYNELKNVGRALNFRKESLPILDSNINFLSKFDKPFREKLLGIKTHIGYINEAIDEARFYFGLTFQSGILPENHKIARSNLENLYTLIASQSKVVAGLISKVSH